MRGKVLSLCMALVLTAGLAACGGTSTNSGTADNTAGGGAASGGTASVQSSAPAEWKFTRTIELVCPWGAGGGADTTLRAFASALEKELNVSIVINNKAGAGGATGVDYTIKQPADGYTFMLATQSLILAQLTGATAIPVYESIVPIVNMVHDVNIIVTGKNSPYNNLDELFAYIEANPGVVKAGCMSITGLDGLLVRQVFEGSVEAIAYSEGAQLNADIMGGHMPLAVVGPAEVMGLIQSGDIKVVAVCAENRLTMPEMQDVGTTAEAGIEAYFGPARGIHAAKGTPEEAIEAFAAAAERALLSEEFLSWAATQGLDQRKGFMNREEYTVFWDEEYKTLNDLL